MEDKKFYDIHCHTMNLSHPNFLAFLRRFEETLKGNRLKVFFQINVVLILYLFFNSSFPRAFEKIGKKAGLNKAVNLLALSENDIGNIIILLEKCIKSHSFKDGKLMIGSNSYSKIVLTPLMMDFGYKNLRLDDLHYCGKPTQKPIVEQVIDVFNGIRLYTEQYQNNKEERLFEIYPFLGINTKNYTLDKVEKLLVKYFKNYTGRGIDLLENMGKFDGNIDNIGSNFFAGIKLYPPLGFDPWPEKDKEELEKVKYLYAYCCERQIPITAHCGSGGFRTADMTEIMEFTSPKKWSKVLNEYKDLKINLAHLGAQENSKEWQKEVINLMLEYDNVYTDFSYRAVNDKYYKTLKKIIDRAGNKEVRNKLKTRILYGSDFMISLLKTDSYCQYLNLFIDTKVFTPGEKDDFCCNNPERFLFK
mgnify:CR=1 FL=1